MSCKYITGFCMVKFFKRGALICFALSLIIGVVGVLCVPILRNYHGNKGIQAYYKGDYYTAAKYCRLAAKRGNTECQYILGQCYANGRVHGDVVLIDWTEAVMWYRLPARQGHAGAIEALKRLGVD